MNIFNEDELFSELKKKIINDLVKKDQFSRTDCSSVEFDATIELKCRKTHYQQLMIERDKYNAIKNSPTKNKRYINSTPEGVFSFDIDKIKEPEWIYIPCPKTTEFANRNKVNKEVGLIDINDAKDISKIFLN